MSVQFIKVPSWKNFRKTWDRRRKQFYNEAMKLVVQDITDGINKGIDATGHSFPSLEPETIKAKGHSKPLINRGLLKTPSTYRMENFYANDYGVVSVKGVYAEYANLTTGKGVAGTADTPRDKVAVALQIDGVDSKRGKKYFRFFGISKDAVDRIMGLIGEITVDALESM